MDLTESIENAGSRTGGKKRTEGIVMNKGMTAGTVYKWSCPNCRVHYIGSSTRNLYVRASEHAGVSFRTGQHLSHPPHSSIRDHALDCNSFQHIRVDNFNIIGTSRNSTELPILGSIFIHKTKPPLNNTQSAVPPLHS